MSGRFTRLELEEKRRAGSGVSEDLAGTPVRTAAHHREVADESYRAGHFETALQMYTRALGVDRSLLPAWVGQLQMLVELREYPEARLWADKALELFRNNGELLAAKAQACLRQGDSAAAAACADASLQNSGSSSFRWRVRGEVVLRRSPDRARDCFEKSLAEAGADWFDRVLIARVYLFHALPAAAVSYAQLGVDREPSSPFAWLILGRCQQGLGLAERAAASYSRCRELPGGRADAEAAMRELSSCSRLTHARRWLGGLLNR
jgi:tetratricopeptide (TPR) repeat protein